MNTSRKLIVKVFSETESKSDKGKWFTEEIISELDKPSDLDSFLHPIFSKSWSLRASVALVLAAIVSHGKSYINRIYHLDRGYEKIENKLKKIGVKIKRLK